MEKILWAFFFTLSNMKNVREHFIRVSKIFDIYRAND